MPTVLEMRMFSPDGRTELGRFRDFVDIEGPGLDYVVNAGQESGLVASFSRQRFNTNFLRPDVRIGVWISVLGRPLALDSGAIFLLQEWTITPRWIQIRAEHANSLLRRRRIAYADETTYVEKGPDFAGNIIKEYVRENMGSSIVAADRDGGSSAQTGANVSNFLTIDSDQNDGATVQFKAVRRILLHVLTDVAEASSESGTYLTWQVWANSPEDLVFRTFENQLGTDRGSASSKPVTLSHTRGHLENPRLSQNFSKVANAIIGLGEGDDSDRLVIVGLDEESIRQSPFGRREDTVEDSQIDDSDVLTDRVNATLRNSREAILLVGDLNESSSLVMGVHWNFGDILVAEFEDQYYDVRADVFRRFVQNKKVVQQIYLRGPI